MKLKCNFLYFRHSYGFRAGDNKSTTNVAWLVGAAGGVTQDLTPHHIDIPAPHSVTPPSHLAVAPLASSTTNIRMGYTLCRSKTVSDMPCYEGESDNSDKQTRVKGVKRNSSSVSGLRGDESAGSRYDMSQAGTISTQGSLRSRIVRHRTLLGSSSRLYKFSQSLSSLTTITSASTASTLRCVLKLAAAVFFESQISPKKKSFDSLCHVRLMIGSNLNTIFSRDPNIFEPITPGEKLDR